MILREGKAGQKRAPPRENVKLKSDAFYCVTSGGSRLSLGTDPVWNPLRSRHSSPCVSKTKRVWMNKTKHILTKLAAKRNIARTNEPPAREGKGTDYIQLCEQTTDNNIGEPEPRPRKVIILYSRCSQETSGPGGCAAVATLQKSAAVSHTKHTPPRLPPPPLPPSPTHTAVTLRGFYTNSKQ